MSVFYALETSELPRLLYAAGLLPQVNPNKTTDDVPRIDLSPIRQFQLRVCLGKEWYRFPGHYLVPDAVRVDFVKSEFEGLLPGHFGEGSRKTADRRGFGWWLRDETRDIPLSLNDLNQEEPSHYVGVLMLNQNVYLLMSSLYRSLSIVMII